MTLSSSDVQEKCQEILESAVQFSVDDPINNLKRSTGKTSGNIVVDLARAVLSHRDRLQSVATVMIDDIFQIMFNGSMLDEKFVSSMWGEIHNYTLKPKIELWRTILDNSVFLKPFYSFHHTTSMKIVEEILKLENQKTVKPAEIEPFKITEEEQKVLRYVAGYITYSLIQRYKKLSSSSVVSTRETANAAIDFLQSLDTKFEKDINARSFLQYTNQWVDAKNRGGLVTVNDDMFIFIRRVENVVRNTLSIQLLKTYRGMDLREMLYGELESSCLIDSGWSIVARNIGNESLKKMLKKHVLDKWVDIKARSYVNCYIQILKRMVEKRKDDDKAKKKPSSKAEPALRKTLT